MYELAYAWIELAEEAELSPDQQHIKPNESGEQQG
jgi:hypothetical protein